eukprot:11947552-Prorocentrum_lima.AAC.1
MTSSLVGSEMCIRDRYCTRTRTSAMRKTKELVGPRWVDCWDSPESPVAVSYTHLTLPTICSV